jgi:hypothetical protein
MPASMTKGEEGKKGCLFLPELGCLASGEVSHLLMPHVLHPTKSLPDYEGICVKFGHVLVGVAESVAFILALFRISVTTYSVQ